MWRCRYLGTASGTTTLHVDLVLIDSSLWCQELQTSCWHYLMIVAHCIEYNITHSNKNYRRTGEMNIDKQQYLATTRRILQKNISCVRIQRLHQQPDINDSMTKRATMKIGCRKYIQMSLHPVAMMFQDCSHETPKNLKQNVKIEIRKFNFFVPKHLMCIGVEIEFLQPHKS